MIVHWSIHIILPATGRIVTAYYSLICLYDYFFRLEKKHSYHNNGSRVVPQTQMACLDRLIDLYHNADMKSNIYEIITFITLTRGIVYQDLVTFG